MKKLLLAFTLCTLSAITAFAQKPAAKNPWVGTWKLDLAKSHFAGYTFTFSQPAEGLMRYSNGAATIDFHADGKEHPGKGTRTYSWTKVNDNVWDSVHLSEGAVVAKSHHEISADGKSLTVVKEGTLPNGTHYRDVENFTRIAGTTGLVGTWRSTNQVRSAEDTVVVLPSPPGTVKYMMSSSKATVEGKIDGSAIPIKGSTLFPEGASIAIKKAGPNKITYALSCAAKVQFEGYQTLSADRKSLTDVSWIVGKEEEKSTGVYIRQ